MMSVRVSTPLNAENDADDAERSNEVISAACRGDAYTVSFLLDKSIAQANAGWRGNNAAPFWTAYASDAALRGAAAGGHLEVVQLLLSQHGSIVDPSASDNEALRAALAGGHELVALRLLESPAVLSSVTCDTLDDALRGGCLSIARSFLARGIEPRMSTLFIATMKGHHNLLALLISTHAHLLIMSPRVLLAAVTRGDIDVVISLLELLKNLNGCSSDVFKHQCSAALIGACKVRRIGIAELLIDAGADELGIALKAAAGAGALAIVIRLLNTSRGIELIRTYGSTSLQSALVFGRPEVAAELQWRGVSMPQELSESSNIRIRRTCSTASAMLAKRRRALIEHTLLLNKIRLGRQYLPVVIMNEILVFLHESRLRGQTLREKLAHLARIRRLEH